MDVENIDGAGEEVKALATLDKDGFGLLRILADIVEVPAVTVSGGWLRFAGFSHDHVAYLVASCRAYGDAAESRTFSVDLAEMLRRLKLKAEHRCRLYLVGNILRAVVKHVWKDEEYVEEFETFPVGEPEKIVERLRSMQFEASFEMSPNLLKKALELVDAVSDFVVISVNSTSQHDENGAVKLVGGGEYRPKVEVALRGVTCAGVAESAYPLRYLLAVVRRLTESRVSSVKAELKAKHPARLSFYAPMLDFSAEVYVAPRILDDVGRE